MKCEKCGQEINTLLVDVFRRDGSDDFDEHPVLECEENAAYIETTPNWTGYEVSEEEMLDTITARQEGGLTMERLTYDFALGGNHCWQVKGADNLECREVCERQGDDGCKTCPISKAFDRLAAIEDILGDEYELDRLRELVEADRAIKSALSAQKEPEDTYPCTDHECYDRGNYHITCKSQCPYHK